MKKRQKGKHEDEIQTNPNRLKKKKGLWLEKGYFLCDNNAGKKKKNV